MTVKEFMKNDKMSEYTLYTTDRKHYLFKDEFLEEYGTDLEVEKVEESAEGKIVFVKE